MPTYEYECQNPLCKRILEHVCSMKDHKPSIQCPICGDDAKAIISRVAVHDDHPKWLTPGIVNQIQGDDDVAPIETRSEYEAHCKKHNIVVTDRRV